LNSAFGITLGLNFTHFPLLVKQKERDTIESMWKENPKELMLTNYDDPGEFLNKAEQHIKVTEVVLDIGCGIYPINFFAPKVHIMVEPWKEYVDILKERYKRDSKILVFQANALDVLKTLADKSVDSVFMLDVIEHLEKEDGKILLTEVERVVIEQIVVFTPLGYMPQHIEVDKRDRWGLNGGEFQEHKSGWLPEDFGGDWEYHVCPEFHKYDDYGKELFPAFGAFYAIKNLTPSDLMSQETYAREFFKPTAKDRELNALTKEFNTVTQGLNQELNALTQELNALTHELNIVTHSYSWKMTSILRKMNALLRSLFNKFRIQIQIFQSEIKSK
jgi:hypothetical protein